jgi:hypothetical protein
MDYVSRWPVQDAAGRALVQLEARLTETWVDRAALRAAPIARHLHPGQAPTGMCRWLSTYDLPSGTVHTAEGMHGCPLVDARRVRGTSGHLTTQQRLYTLLAHRS